MQTGDKKTEHRMGYHSDTVMAICLGVMALSVFINVILRYGFGSGIAASEELSRLLFVWMVFIGAAAAYPRGEHMAFTSLLGLLKDRQGAFKAMTILIRVLTVIGCSLIAWGAWQQVLVGMTSRSVVIGYPAGLLPLPAFLCCLAIAIFALFELIIGKPLALNDSAEVE